ncbi:MAG: DUF192 domain-containing protein [Magnetospiraceae bacterium]
MKRLALLLMLLFAAPTFAEGALSPLTIEVGEGAVVFQVELADDDAERAVGLMNRTELPASQGMLFDYRQPRSVAMWMKNTLIPLDMLFIGADGRIVNIVENAEPLTLTPRRSAGPVRAVLELPGGTVAALGIKSGAKVRHAVFNR